MNLRLNDEDTDALRAYAASRKVSMQVAALDAVRKTIHDDRVAHLSAFLVERDRDLLDRLAE